MIKLDLTKFKHHSSDDKTTTLQHADGHQITLAHKALDKKTQAQLSALSKLAPAAETPLEQDQMKHKMATGGGVDRTKNITSDAVKGTQADPPGSSVSDKIRGALGMPTPTPKPNYDEGGTVGAPYDPHHNDRKPGVVTTTQTNSINNPTPADPKTWWAEGGQVDPRKVDKTPQSPRKDKPSGGTLDYKQIKKEYLEKNKPRFADGGQAHTHDEPCPMCGGGSTKMYAGGTDYVTPAQPGEEYDPGTPHNFPGEDSPAQDTSTKLPGDPGYDNGKQSNFDKITAWTHRNEKPQPVEAQNPIEQSAQTEPMPDATKDIAAELGVSDGNQTDTMGTPAASPAPQSTAGAVKPYTPPGNIPTQPPTVQTAAQSPKTYQQHLQDTKQDILQEGQHFQHDMDSGHITPKTYADLFHDKGTLGKIGTIFGMMVSGMGSGLSHQPNAMLEMMNKQIDNDLKAQQNSKENAINYMKLNQQDSMNKAQIGQMQHTAGLTDQQAIAMNLESQAKAKIMMQRAALHDLVSKLPPVGSPQRPAAEQQLAMINQSVQNDNYDLADRAAAGSAYYKTLFGQGQQGLQGPAADQEEAFKQQNNGLRTLGDMGQKKAEYNEQHHIPGYGQLAVRPIPEDTQKQVLAMNVLDNKGKDLLNFVKQNSGTLNPQQRAIAQQKVEEMKNFYNDSIKGGALTEGRLGWYDEQFKKNPTDIIPQLLGSNSKLNEMVNSNSNRRDMLVKSMGIDPKSHYGNTGGNAAQSAAQPQEGATAIQKSTGKPIIFKNGAWGYR